MCVDSAHFDFNDDKVILIIGPNGSGKSTVLESIALCLVENKRADTYKDFIKNGEDHAYIKLEAEICGNPISFDITLNQKSPPMERTVEYDGKSYHNSEVSALLDTFELKYFSEIIMSMQGADDITKLTPSQRETFLQKLLNFDFSAQVESCKNEFNDLKQKIDYNNNLIEFNTKTISDRKSEIREIKDLTFTESDIKRLNTEISELSEKVSKINESISERNSILNEKTSLLNEKSVITTEVSKIDLDISSLKNNIQLGNNYITQVNESILKVDEEVKSLDKVKEELEQETKSFDDFIKQESLESLVDYKSKINELTVKKNDVIKQLAEKNAVVSTAEKHLSLIGKGLCPECGHTFDSKDTEKYQNELESAKVEVTNTSNVLTELETEIQKETGLMEEQDRKVKSFEEKKVSFETKINLLKRQVSMIGNPSEKLEGLKESITKYETSNKESELQIGILNTKKSDLESKIPSIDSKIKEIEDKASELDSVCNEYRSVELQRVSKVKELEELNKQVIENGLIIQNNKNIENNIIELENSIRDASSNITSYSNKKTTVNDVINILDKNLPQYLIIKTCAVLEKEMNDFIQTIFPNMEIRLFQNKKGVEFFYTIEREDTIVFDKENLINIKMASGFEKALLSIAFKISLCKAYGLRFAFFDEIDQSSTDENSETLFKTITSNGFFDQVFIITHKPVVRDAIKTIAPNLKAYYVHGKGNFSLEEDY